MHLNAHMRRVVGPTRRLWIFHLSHLRLHLDRGLLGGSHLARLQAFLEFHGLCLKFLL
jgi:hypothetical protein